MMLNLNKDEASALSRELATSGPELDTVRDKLARIMEPEAPHVIPGQTDIYDHLEDAA